MSACFVYVAGPYSSPDPAVNTANAIKVATQLLDLGYVPFCPHLCHLWHLVNPRPYEDWLDYDNQWITKCEVLLRMPGASSGADKEMALAAKLGVPVVHSLEQLLASYPPAPKPVPRPE